MQMQGAEAVMQRKPDFYSTVQSSRQAGCGSCGVYDLQDPVILQRCADAGRCRLFSPVPSHTSF
jgi:hypothetical protein